MERIGAFILGVAAEFVTGNHPFAWDAVIRFEGRFPLPAAIEAEYHNENQACPHQLVLPIEQSDGYMVMHSWLVASGRVAHEPYTQRELPGKNDHH